MQERDNAHCLEVVDKPVVKVLTTQVGVASSGLDLKNALLDGEQGNIEGTATKVENENIALADGLSLLVQAIGNGCCCGLVDDPQDLQLCDDSSIFGGLQHSMMRFQSTSKMLAKCMLKYHGTS